MSRRHIGVSGIAASLAQRGENLEGTVAFRRKGARPAMLFDGRRRASAVSVRLDLSQAAQLRSSWGLQCRNYRGRWKASAETSAA